MIGEEGGKRKRETYLSFEQFATSKGLKLRSSHLFSYVDTGHLLGDLLQNEQIKTKRCQQATNFLTSLISREFKYTLYVPFPSLELVGNVLE